MKRRTLLLLAMLLCVGGMAFGQKAAVKTNALYWGTTTPNLALEFGIGPRTSIEVAGGYNDWTLGKSDWINGENKRLSHWLVQPELRHWFCERFAGTFIGVHAHGGEFNVQGIGPFKILKNNRHEGWFIGAGVSIGHQWLFGKRWGVEAELGVGYAYIDYERYGCVKCDPIDKKGHYHYVGPTRTAISLVYYLW